MNAIEFPGVNIRIAEDQPEYQTLPAFGGDIPIDDAGNTVPGITCCFKLTPEELAEVNRTGVIWHTVLTFGQPLQPQAMSIQRPEWLPAQPEPANEI